MLGVQAAFVASHEKGRLKWWLPGMTCTLFNEYVSFVQALRLDFFSIGSGSLIWFTRSFLPYTSLWVTRNGTRKCLRKNWSQMAYLMSDWNEKLKIHIWGKMSLCNSVPFLSSLVCTEKNLVLLLCKKETVFQAVLITVLVWTRNSLKCHPQVLRSPSFSVDCVPFVIMAVRRNCEDGLLAMTMPGKDTSFEEGTSGWVGLFVLFCKEILSSHFIFSSLFTGVQMCWRGVFQFSTYV